jgi:Pyridoxamine 5'-phosphate oxidase
VSAAPRSRAQRRRDTEHRLTHDIDVWVASASADGGPYLVPLSFDWDDEALLVATPTDSPTGRNLAATRTVRLGLGHTRDVSMIDGEVEVLEIGALPQQRGDRFAARTGFDPRALSTPYRWFRIFPRRIQAWREANELPDRELMRDGRWLVGAPSGPRGEAAPEAPRAEAKENETYRSMPVRSSEATPTETAAAPPKMETR